VCIITVHIIRTMMQQTRTSRCSNNYHFQIFIPTPSQIKNVINSSEKKKKRLCKWCQSCWAALCQYGWVYRHRCELSLFRVERDVKKPNTNHRLYWNSSHLWSRQLDKSAHTLVSWISSRNLE
jgi:hypothetical protein